MTNGIFTKLLIAALKEYDLNNLMGVASIMVANILQPGAHKRESFSNNTCISSIQLNTAKFAKIPFSFSLKGNEVADQS